MGKTRFAVVSCHRNCTLNPDKMPPDVAAKIHGWYEEGLNRNKIRENAQLIGYTFSTGAIGNHKSKHLKQVHGRAIVGERPIDRTGGQKRSDLEIIDAFIQRGAQSIDLSSFTVTGEQLLKAIDLKQRLTQGSLFEDFYAAIGASMDEPAEEPKVENPEAAQSTEEQEQAASED